MVTRPVQVPFDENGLPEPGFVQFVWCVLHIEPLLNAKVAFQHPSIGFVGVVRFDKAWAGTVEAFPSSVLQLYVIAFVSTPVSKSFESAVHHHHRTFDH